MAQKKLIYDLDGKVKESTGNYYDDSNNSLVLKNVTFNSMSLGLSDGLAFISASQISSSGVSDNQIVTWNSSSAQWSLNDVVVSVAGVVASSSWDISGTFGINEKIRNLSNVTTGILPVQYGGTGLQTSSYPSGEILLVGNNTNPLNFLTTSAGTIKKVLTTTNTGWTFTDYNDSTVVTTANVYLTNDTWSRGSGVKAIRVLVQGAGGGGGSGANRATIIPAALGGTGGAAGGFIDSGLFNVDEQIGTIPIIVGIGGVGGNFSSAGNSGNSGSAGGSSSFGTYFYAQGGNGGFSGSLSITAISGGASVSGFTNVYDNFLYGSRVISTSLSGSANRANNAGINNIFTTASLYYGAGGGASGGSLTANSATSYAGGNAGTVAPYLNGGSTSSPNASTAISHSTTIDGVYLASGGGGGASQGTLGVSGGSGSSGAWGSGGGGGGASSNSSATGRQGGNGGDGYVVVISYAY